MIYITSIRDKRLSSGEFDEVWAIVRSAKKLGPHYSIKHVPELSPSWELFGLYRRLVEANHWNIDTFNQFYRPTFLNEMQHPSAQYCINRLTQLHYSGKSIALCCFCKDEELCHRSIIAGILQSRGISVEGVNGDYRC